jgi:hypothetical protein
MMKPECRTLEQEPDLPFNSYYDKFGLNPEVSPFQQRSEQELLFEFALHCILYPLSGDAPRSRNRLVKYLEDKLGISAERYQEILSRVEEFGPGKKVQLFVRITQLCSLY